MSIRQLYLLIVITLAMFIVGGVLATRELNKQAKDNGNTLTFIGEDEDIVIKTTDGGLGDPPGGWTDDDGWMTVSINGNSITLPREDKETKKRLREWMKEQ